MVRSRANYDGGACRDASSSPVGTVRVDHFAPNPWGLYQMHGNIWEWCDDEWHDSYDGAPGDGSSWLEEEATLRVVRGGSWMSVPTLLRSAARNKERPAIRMNTIGFRVARALEASRYAN
jgi:formylglycine-generating enzyme required for sulfatase activity